MLLGCVALPRAYADAKRGIGRRQAPGLLRYNGRGEPCAPRRPPARCGQQPQAEGSVTLTDSLRQIAYAPMRHPSPLSRYRPPVRWELRAGAVFMAGIPPQAGPRLVCLFGATPSLAWALAEAERFYGGEDAYELCIDADLRGAELPLLAQRGFALTEQEPGLVLPHLPAPDAIPAAPPELQIAPVQDQAGLDTFFSITSTPRFIVPSVAAATDPEVALLVGWVDGQPVATARLSLSPDGVADIMGVVTVEAARRRGYGTAMTWAAVAVAARRGATAATLTATAMGYPVYRKMGFLHACTFQTYETGAGNAAE